MINEQIRDREVRVIGTDGQQLGVMSSRDSQKLADEAELDLIKISPKAKPPFCKIMDYGKFRYEQQKRDKSGWLGSERMGWNRYNGSSGTGMADQ